MVLSTNKMLLRRVAMYVIASFKIQKRANDTNDDGMRNLLSLS